MPDPTEETEAETPGLTFWTLTISHGMCAEGHIDDDWRVDGDASVAELIAALEMIKFELLTGVYSSDEDNATEE